MRRPSRRNTTVVRARGSLIPDAFLVKLKYSELFGFTYTPPIVSDPVSAVYQFRLNSIYDPNLTGTGHQPLGHDQWALFYNRYLVYGCKFVVTFTSISTTDQGEIAIQLRPNSLAPSNIETIREDPLTVYKSCIGTEDAGQAIKVARGYGDVAKIRGIPKSRLKNESDYQAIFGNNPPIDPTLNIYMINQNVLNTLDMRVRVDLVYYCRFYDRKQLTQS